MRLSAALHRQAPADQRGITLIESLVALTILAVAVLAMLGVQLRTLVEARTSAHRVHAVRLIDDLAERIGTNPQGAAHAALYLSDFTATFTDPPRCDLRACDGAELARWDMAEWRNTVAQSLPQGQAAVFAVPEDGIGGGIGGGIGDGASTHRQFGVVLGWSANEQHRANASDAQAQALRAPFLIDTGDAAVGCPAGLICHVAYVQP